MLVLIPEMFETVSMVLATAPTIAEKSYLWSTGRLRLLDLDPDGIAR